ncbi:MAG: hypothetical protein HC896_08080 [Bacteroidales bacterium]|nr:hypothetical protein [Bacteroidales bacterium]
MNQISFQYKEIQKEMWDYTSSMAHGSNARKVEKNRYNLLKTIKASIASINGMEPFNGDPSYRDSVAAYLQLNFDVLNNDFGNIVDLEEVAEQSYDQMEAYLLAKKLANEKLEESTHKIGAQYKAFASAYGVNVIEDNDPISKKLQISAEVTDYYNPVYLTFFKAYKQEIYLLDALARNDINGLEQSRNALMAYANEGIVSLSKIKHFKGDNSVNAACKQALEFYKDEAENKVQVLSDFIILKNEYEEMAKLFESKDRMLISDQEAQRYNKAVAEFNSSVNKYNATNNKLNKDRNQCVENWNRSVASFLERHIPKK